MSEKFFTIEEAEELIPQLEVWLRTIVECKKMITIIESEFADLLGKVSNSGGATLDIQSWIEKKRDEEEHGNDLRAAARLVMETGCLIKDLDIGLLDFPCELEGKEIYLCWKMGEPSIGFWHGTDEGFASRKPIDRPFTEHFKPRRTM
jgi:hypothetical protein